MAKKKLTRDDIKEKIAGLLVPIKRAADLGKWTGFDGAQQYIEGDVMKMLADTLW